MPCDENARGIALIEMMSTGCFGLTKYYMEAIVLVVGLPAILITVVLGLAGVIDMHTPAPSFVTVLLVLSAVIVTAIVATYWPGDKLARGTTVIHFVRTYNPIWHLCKIAKLSFDAWVDSHSRIR